MRPSVRPEGDPDSATNHACFIGHCGPDLAGHNWTHISCPALDTGPQAFKRRSRAGLGCTNHRVATSGLHRRTCRGPIRPTANHRGGGHCFHTWCRGARLSTGPERRDYRSGFVRNWSHCHPSGSPEFAPTHSARRKSSYLGVHHVWGGFPDRLPNLPDRHCVLSIARRLAMGSSPLGFRWHSRNRHFDAHA